MAFAFGYTCGILKNNSELTTPIEPRIMFGSHQAPTQLTLLFVTGGVFALGHFKAPIKFLMAKLESQPRL